MSAARDACHLRELTTLKALQTLTLPSRGHQKALKKGPEGLRGHVFSDTAAWGWPIVLHKAVSSLEKGV